MALQHDQPCGATNTTLLLPSAQFTNAGNYTVLVSNVVNSILSSNALLTVNDILDHFTWGQIPLPRFMNAPFTVVIQARGTTNGLFTNFTGTVFLGSTNGIPIDPPVSASFVQGAWTGAVTVSRPATNLVMRADDGAGQSGLANPINILNPPALGFASSGNFLLIFWPVAIVQLCAGDFRRPFAGTMGSSRQSAAANWRPISGINANEQLQSVLSPPVYRSLTRTSSGLEFRLQAVRG